MPIDIKPSAPGPSLRPDWWSSKPRVVVNILEMLVFAGAAIAAFLRDRANYRHEVGDLVAAELGHEGKRASLKEILASENPIVQTAMNRFKILYSLRFLQPLTFLWGVQLGATTTIVQVVGERAAYLHENSYDRLQKLMGECARNQWGSWSREALVAQVIDIVQQNRSEHKAVPLSAKEVETYCPLFSQVADRMIDKSWRFSEVAYVLGQIIKEPADVEAAKSSLDDIARYGLRHLVRDKRAAAGRSSAPPAPEARPAGEAEEERRVSKVAKEIVANGQRQPLERPADPGYSARSSI